MATKEEYYPCTYPLVLQSYKPHYRKKRHQPATYANLGTEVWEGNETNVYNLAKSYVLSEEELKKYGYPHRSPEDPNKTVCIPSIWEIERSDKCSRCLLPYSPTTEKDTESVAENKCQYHRSKPIQINGKVKRRHPCCGKKEGAPGCQVCSYHVSSSYNLDTKPFVSTAKKDSDKRKNYIYSLDCEMCYTLSGLEVARVSVITYYGFLIYETYVLPEAPVVDYNTEYSGITADNLKGITVTLSDVQEKLLELFDADTILVGHALDNDLKALGLMHEMVIDTSVLFPHRCGWPYRRSLKSLAETYLSYSIQQYDSGHDSIEDARACLNLLYYKMLGFC